jgi:hypothetical protein
MGDFGDAKVHWAETVDKLATVNSRFPGNPGSLVERQKVCMNLHSTLHTATCGQASLDYWENMGNWAWNVPDID